jgi:hypothetical protein
MTLSIDTENESKRRIDRNYKITKADAEEIFRFLVLTSRARKANDVDGIILVWMDDIFQWRGFKTNPPDAAMCIERKTKRHEQLKNSYRTKIGDLLPCSRQEAIETICERFNCDESEANRLLKVFHANGILIYHKPTRTWYGCDCDEMPSEKVSTPLTSKQDQYMDRYGSVFPPLAHNWQNIDQSPIILAISDLDGATPAEAFVTYKRIWGVARDREKTALVKQPDGLVRSRNYVAPIVLSDEQKTALARVTFFETKASFERQCANVLGIDLSRIAKVLEEEKSLWIQGEAEGLVTSEGKTVSGYWYAGSAQWEKYRKVKAREAEKKKSEAERLEAERLEEEQRKADERVKMWGLKGQPSTELKPKEIFYGMEKGRYPYFEDRAREYCDYHGINGANLTPESLVQMCVTKGHIVEEKGIVNGKFGTTGRYKLS